MSLRVRTQCGRGASELVSMHATKPFSQLVGGGEAEVADLVQVLDPHVATRSANDQQRADRFHVTIGGLRDPRRTTRQRGPRRFDRVNLVGLAGTATLLAVRTVDLDHHQTPAAEMAREAGAVGAGAFHPDPSRPSRTPPANREFGETGRRRRERLDAQHAAVRVDRRCDMHIQVCIDSTRDWARALDDGHRHPFSLKRFKGWHARPGKETVTSTLL